MYMYMIVMNTCISNGEIVMVMCLLEQNVFNITTLSFDDNNVL